MELTFKVDGVVELSRNMRIAIKDLGEGLETFHKEAVEVVKKRSDELFKTEGKNVENGPNWKALSPVTEKMRSQRKGYYRKPPNNPGVLRWTGNLQDSATKQSSKSEGSLAYTASYAIKHQRGIGVPRRKIIDIDNATSTKIVKVMQKVVNDAFKIFGKQK